MGLNKIEIATEFLFNSRDFYGANIVRATRAVMR